MTKPSLYFLLVVAWLMIGNSSAIGEDIGTEVGTDLTGGGGIDTDDGSSTESIEDPPVFIPAEPYDL